MIGGKRILVVEDEFIVAAMLCDILEDEGAIPIGPVGRVSEAVSMIEQDMFDVAVLDWNLHGESSEPVALALAARGVPFVIATGYGAVDGVFSDRPILGKPYIPQVLLERIAALLAD
ncbi:DNA-binding response OmpR family regulator [Novosphingobium hassiacum]|uniref:DNA-binding response OmpR family regulator n=1 Tax=Novosphingobium hassiacum TaxID=173676 RepID=A0A7W5ZTH4_9SPHN|nr:response regulator [Novosphingobium hassiacum]MBB3858939.1 DNA-binding response OmpR family regulator [Novosphingobium hassiacum]